MMKIYRKLNIFLFSLPVLLAFACSSDDEIEELTLAKDNIKIESRFLIPSMAIDILGGNGGYSVTSKNKSIATAEVKDNKVHLTFLAAGKTKVTLTDSEAKTTDIDVEVDTKKAGDGEIQYRMKWKDHDITVAEDGLDLNNMCIGVNQSNSSYQLFFTSSNDKKNQYKLNMTFWNEKSSSSKLETGKQYVHLTHIYHFANDKVVQNGNVSGCKLDIKYLNDKAIAGEFEISGSKGTFVAKRYKGLNI